MGKQKGDRRERQAREVLSVAGYSVESPNSTQYHQDVVDFFELFDFMAIKQGRKILFGQVKSNTARGIRSFPEKCVEKGVPFEHAKVEFWVCHDNEGWRIFEIDPQDSTKVYDERDTSDTVLHSKAKNESIDSLPHH